MNKNVKLKRKPDIMAADMDGSTVMLDITTGKYYNLGEVGGDIWTLLENALSMDELIDALTAQYDVDPEQCEKDIVPFIDKLLECGLIVEEK